MTPLLLVTESAAGVLICVVAKVQALSGAHKVPGVGGFVPPLGSTEAWLVIKPAAAGAVVCSVKLAVAPWASVLFKVTEQISDGAVPVQLTKLTPVPAVAPT